jgi:peptide-methionine (S)-S-oxide reductase
MAAAINPERVQAMSHETITLGGGCFWCLEAVYEQVDGVVAVESGYSNGHVQAPTYEQVCAGDTGHVEVVRVQFDPARISLREVLEIFFVIHDPTTLNRQGNDVGPQYRSGIYWHSPQQETEARAVLAEVNAQVGGRAVTEIARRGVPPALLRAQSRAGLLRARRGAQGGEVPAHLRQPDPALTSRRCRTGPALH